MRIRGGAGEAALPMGWPAGEVASRNAPEPTFWRRLCFGANPSRTLRRVLAWASLIVITSQYLLVPIKITGASMSPTYRDGSLNFVNRLSYSTAAPRRGDVVVIRDGEDLILKRVIAIPGERVTLEHGVFKINGAPLHDQFSQFRVNWEIEPVQLGQDDYFVIGDNRVYSMFGKFRREQILGKIIF